MKINPVKGTKRQTGKRVKNGKAVQPKIEPVNLRVMSLLQKLATFEWTQ